MDAQKTNNLAQLREKRLEHEQKLANVKHELLSGEKHSAIMIGRVASIFTIMMYVSYIPEIMANLQGHPVNILQPTVAAFNGFLWCAYALNKRHRDLAVFIGNFPGIIFGIITVVTAFIH